MEMALTAVELEAAWRRPLIHRVRAREMGRVVAFVEAHPGWVGEPGVEDIETASLVVEKLRGHLPPGTDQVSLAKLVKGYRMLKAVWLAKQAREHAGDN